MIFILTNDLFIDPLQITQNYYRKKIGAEELKEV